ncbi:MAG: P-type DNA transfer ATPase VirB11, partial [Gammaproteobacteria bacterium]|nr:P-type DNA transfer ATPase VirB11 [Gammaproteobacteria bacterium]
MSTFSPTSNGLLEPLSPWLNDDQVSEILLNKPQEIYVEKNGTLKRFTISELNIRTLDRLFQLIANENQQELNAQHPLLSGNLLDGTRVQLVLPPIAKHHTFSIRRKVVRHFSLENYQEINFFDRAKPFHLQTSDGNFLSPQEKQLMDLYQRKQWHDFLVLAIQLKKNIVISGGTSSGKTTFLNACLCAIPLEERMLILEDTREVEILHPNQVQLLASKGEQGLAKISMQDLVQCCLRLRPDRIICGEIRGKEILDFVSACSTGHEGSMTTIHANNPRIAFMRMCQMYKLNNVPSMTDEDIMRALHAVID